jgi:hypothetical protein
MDTAERAVAEVALALRPVVAAGAGQAACAAPRSRL